MGEHEIVLVIDDLFIARDNIALLLASDHEIVAKAGSLEETKKLMEAGFSHEPTVAIVDDEMPSKGDGEHVAALLREKFPHIHIISMSTNIQSYGEINLDKTATRAEIKAAVASF